MPLPPKVAEEREAFVKQVVEDIRAGHPLFWDSGNYGKPQRNLIADMAGKPRDQRHDPDVYLRKTRLYR